MRDLHGKFRPRLVLCRLFGHWWSRFWSDPFPPMPTGNQCLNCGAKMYDRRGAAWTPKGTR